MFVISGIDYSNSMSRIMSGIQILGNLNFKNNIGIGGNNIYFLSTKKKIIIDF